MEIFNKFLLKIHVDHVSCWDVVYGILLFEVNFLIPETGDSKNICDGMP